MPGYWNRPATGQSEREEPRSWSGDYGQKVDRSQDRPGGRSSTAAAGAAATAAAAKAKAAAAAAKAERVRISSTQSFAGSS